VTTLTNAGFFKAVLTDDLEVWDAFVEGSGGHILQCGGWGELKAQFGWSVKRVMVWAKDKPVAGAQVLLRRTPLGQLAYVPRGPVVDFGNDSLVRVLLAKVHEEARLAGAFMLKVEPNLRYSPPLAALGFRPSSQTVQPATTIVVDLNLDLKTLSSLQKPKTRYNIGLAARRGVVVRPGTAEDLVPFYRAMETTSKRDGFGIHSFDYYRSALELLGDKAQLFVAEFAGELLGGIVVTCLAGEAIYMYGASSDAHRNLMPNHLLQWEAMKWAKARGCSTYDFWGVPDEVGATPENESDSDRSGAPRQDGLWGVYRFKRGFGGTLVRFAGAFDHVYSPVRYLIWRRFLPLVRKRGIGG